MEEKSNIQTLSSLIVKSINDKKLDTDYSTLLEMCRNEGISSYTLNLMIDCAVSSVQNDLQIKSVNTSPQFGWQIKEVFLPKPKVKAMVTTKTILKISSRWGWKTWFLFTVFLFLFGYVFYRILNSPLLQEEMFGKIIYLL